MSAIFTVDEAQAKLKELIANLAPGDQIVLFDNQSPVATLTRADSASPARPAPGLGKGSILYMSPDFDEPMDEFKEYAE